MILLAMLVWYTAGVLAVCCVVEYSLLRNLRKNRGWK